MVDAKKIEFEFKKYMDMYKADPELGRLMQQMTFQELFNEKFMKENSKFTSMDDMLFKSDFGLTNPLEIEKVNQEKWNAFIAKNKNGLRMPKKPERRRRKAVSNFPDE